MEHPLTRMRTRITPQRHICTYMLYIKVTFYTCDQFAYLSQWPSLLLCIDSTRGTAQVSTWGHQTL